MKLFNCEVAYKIEHNQNLFSIPLLSLRATIINIRLENLNFCFCNYFMFLRWISFRAIFISDNVWYLVMKFSSFRRLLSPFQPHYESFQVNSWNGVCNALEVTLVLLNKRWIQLVTLYLKSCDKRIIENHSNELHLFTFRVFHSSLILMITISTFQSSPFFFFQFLCFFNHLFHFFLALFCSFPSMPSMIDSLFTNFPQIGMGIMENKPNQREESEICCNHNLKWLFAYLTIERIGKMKVERMFAAQFVEF